MPIPDLFKTRPRMLFIDMDGVVADIHAGVCKLYGYDLDDFNESWPEGVWDLSERCGQTEEQFWDPIHALGADWWRNLPEHEDFSELLHVLMHTPVPYYFLTDPRGHEGACDGKTAWLRDRFGPTFDRFIFTGHKYLLSGPGRVLVDDSPMHCFKWQGPYILWPRKWNKYGGIRSPDIHELPRFDG
jgi:5'(3')-deoxyribonucleotidase